MSPILYKPADSGTVPCDEKVFREFAVKQSFLALCLVLALSVCAHADQLVFVGDVDFAPYSMMQQGRPAGIDVDVMREVIHRLGLDAEIRLVPWTQLVTMFRTGKCDGAMGVFWTPDRERRALFAMEAPIHTSDFVLFTKVGNTFSFRSYDDLKTRRIGVPKGLAITEEFEQAEADGVFPTREYGDIAGAVRELLAGQIDAFVGNIDVTYWQLKRMGMTSSIVYLPRKVADARPAYVLLSRASGAEDKARIAAQIGQTLKAMRSDGSYNRIARNYLLRF